MKKFLSLVLALVMTMSLVTVSAGAADFTDDEDIKYVEAVEVLNLIGVINGNPDGSFNPKGVLTRAQAAKIICALNLTPDVASTLAADTAPFADVAASHWAAGYIAEGVSSGILAGVGNGAFAPDAELTGFAFAKMLLVALGYDASTEGMTGANWSVNVAKLIKKADLTKGIDGFVGSKAVTREVAAQMAFNALKAETVTYVGGGNTTITIGDAVIETNPGKAEEGDTFMAVNYEDLEKVNVKGGDDFGRKAIKWTYDDEETCAVVDSADYVLVAEEAYATLGDMIEDKELDDEIEATNELKNIAIGTVVELWVDDEEVVDTVTYTYTIDTIVDVAELDEEEDLYECGATVEYEFEDLTGKYVDELDCDGCDDCEDYTAIGEWEEDDVVLLTINEDGEAVEYAEVETVVGEVTSKKAGYVKVDGVKYFTALATEYEVEYTFYLDPNGIIIALVEGDATSDDDDEDKEYVYVLKAQAEDSVSDLFNDEDAAAKVKVMYVDGEVEVVDYNLYENDDEDLVFELNGKEKDFSEKAFEEAITAGWYSYEMEDGMISLTEEDVQDIAVSDARSWDGLRANADTELVLLDEDGVYKTYTGRTEMPDATYEDALVVLDGKTVIAVYVYEKEFEDEAETIDVAMFVELGEETKDGTEAIFYVAGEEETYVVADVTALTDSGMLFEIEVDDDDIATVKALSDEDESIVAGEITFVDGEYFEIGETALEMADDCAVYQVNKTGEKVSDGELEKGESVVVILDSEGDAVEIFQYKYNKILAW